MSCHESPAPTSHPGTLAVRPDSPANIAKTDRENAVEPGLKYGEIKSCNCSARSAGERFVIFQSGVGKDGQGRALLEALGEVCFVGSEKIEFAQFDFMYHLHRCTLFELAHLRGRWKRCHNQSHAFMWRVMDNRLFSNDEKFWLVEGIREEWVRFSDEDKVFTPPCQRLSFGKRPRGSCAATSGYAACAESGPPPAVAVVLQSPHVQLRSGSDKSQSPDSSASSASCTNAP
jgi:hypothetical protein